MWDIVQELVVFWLLYKQIYQVRLYYVGNVVLYIISVHVGRNFHVLYSCVVIIFMMFRGCSLLLSHYTDCGYIYIRVVVVVVVYIRVMVVVVVYILVVVMSRQIVDVFVHVVVVFILVVVVYIYTCCGCISWFDDYFYYDFSHGYFHCDLSEVWRQRKVKLHQKHPL